MSIRSRWGFTACAAVGLMLVSAAPAGASLITWEWNGTVAGESGAHTIPAGTPLSIDFSFDSNAANACAPSTSSGIFSTQSADVHVGGGDYRGAGFIESSAGGGTCGLGTETTLRLFVTDAPPSVPGSVPLLLGDFLTVDLPDPMSPGGLPLDLPHEPFASPLSAASDVPFSGRLTLSSVDGELTVPEAVPEPATLALLASGLAVAASRRRKRS